jgi:hypothetical protein
MPAKNKVRKKVTIQFDEEHLQTLTTALEVYSRLRSGQIKLAFDAAFCDKDLTYNDSETIESFVRTLVFRNDKTIADNRNAYYGVGQEEMKDGTVAWEIKKTIEQYLHYQRNDGYRNIMDVSGDGPMQISKVPVPKILNFEPSKTFPVPKKAYDILNKAFEKNDWETMWATVELAFKTKPLSKGKSTKIEKVDNQWVVTVNEPYINK